MAGGRRSPNNKLLMRGHLYLWVGICAFSVRSSGEGHVNSSVANQTRICEYNEMGGKAGQWVYRNGSSKSFRCCGGDGNDWQDPSLVNFCHANSTLMTSGRGCFCDELQFHRHTVSEREKFVWETTNCTTMKWNATYFCELLGPRTLLLIGDSTMKQTASTLRTMIQHDEPPGDCGMQILLRDSDFLVDWGLLEPRPTTVERAAMFKKHLHEIRPDIAILSTGAHYLSVDTYHSMWRILAKGIEDIRRKYKHPPKFVWKTQNPGHHACRTGDHETPLQSIDQYKPIDDKNKWNLHRNYDEIARNKSAELGIQVIDMSPLYLRPDGHPGYLAYDIRGGDCLHYCLPGPLNIFSILVMHMLRSTLNVSGNDDDF